MTILLDTHALHWWTTEPERLGPDAVLALEADQELAVAAITWWELAWLARRGRIGLAIPIRTLVTSLARDVRTMALTPSIAATAAELPDSFPRDPIDRIIFATAVEHGSRLVTKDARMHDHDPGGRVVVW